MTGSILCVSVTVLVDAEREVRLAGTGRYLVPDPCGANPGVWWRPGGDPDAGRGIVPVGTLSYS